MLDMAKIANPLLKFIAPSMGEMREPRENM